MCYHISDTFAERDIMLGGGVMEKRLHQGLVGPGVAVSSFW